MPFSLLDIFFTLSGILILVTVFKIARQDRVNWFHFSIFFLGGIGLLSLTFVPNLRNIVGRFFGVDRGADVLVYISIVVLFYFVLIILYKIEKQREQTTRLVRELALKSAQPKKYEK